MRRPRASETAMSMNSASKSGEAAERMARIGGAFPGMPSPAIWSMRAAMALAKAARARCETGTPLGRPVVPEVK